MLSREWCIGGKVFSFNYKRNQTSRNTFAFLSFTGSICVFKHNHLVEPGVERQKLLHKCIVKTNIEKATLIPHTNVTYGIDDSNKTSHAWMVQSQQHPNMTYKVPLPFTKYACCTCEWALRGNLCKHQVAIFLTCINLPKENIIQYCGTWYGFDHGGFTAMFADPTYLHIHDIEYNVKRPMKITLKNHGLLICASL